MKRNARVVQAARFYFARLLYVAHGVRWGCHQISFWVLSCRRTLRETQRCGPYRLSGGHTSQTKEAQRSRAINVSRMADDEAREGASTSSVSGRATKRYPTSLRRRTRRRPTTSCARSRTRSCGSRCARRTAASTTATRSRAGSRNGSRARSPASSSTAAGSTHATACGSARRRGRPRTGTRGRARPSLAAATAATRAARTRRSARRPLNQRRG